ncbi:MAG: HK97 family phage prohead protease [Rhodocyclaceae bacterium]
MDLEIRAAGTLKAASPGHLSGYAAVFNVESNLGGFVEVIRPGAFAQSLRAGTNVRALYHHQQDALLGTTKGGTLSLHEDSHGLAFSLALPDTTHGRDLAVLVGRGDISGCSFGFRVRDGGDKWERRSNGELLRELRSVELEEITLTHDPAYVDTSVALRSYRAAIALSPDDLRRLWLETF